MPVGPLYRWLAKWLGLSLLLAACGPVTATPAGIVVEVIASATLPGIELPTYPAGARPTNTAAPAVREPTPTPTDSGLRTKTPDPNATAAPSATRTRRPGSAGAETATPTVPGQTLEAGTHGVRATFGLEAPAPAYAPDERVWLQFTLTNLSDDRLSYGAVGFILPNGSFHTSLSGSSLAANETLPWRDWVSFAAPGDYAVTLAMCFSPKPECYSGGRWANLAAPVVVTIKR